MGVVRTDQWLLHTSQKPQEFCKKLKKAFRHATEIEIYDKLTAHGMFQRELPNSKEYINTFTEKNFWNMVREEELKLSKLWNGPEVPIFIFPSDPFNRELNMEHNGKSGLAFHDKLFLFVSTKNSAEEIRALFTHEYNHVCRLAKFSKKETEYTLLDTMVLEGIAENAVQELIGKDYLANWATLYTEKELKIFWKQLLPVCHLPINHPKHNHFLYGYRTLPKMLGYSVGYYLVKQFLEISGLTIKETLAKASKEIAQLPNS